MEVRRIGLVDLNGILRAADANVKVRELLDTQRQNFKMNSVLLKLNFSKPKEI